jgi:HEPN domain-containing protein
MSELVSREYLIESFHEIVSEIKDTINEMTSNQNYLHVFDNKDINGSDFTDFQFPTPSQTMLMHLYIEKLSQKNTSWNLFPFPETDYTEMYKNIVVIKHPQDFIGSNEEDLNSTFIPVTEDWDDTDTDDVISEQPFLSKFFSYLLSFFMYVNVFYKCYFRNVVAVEESSLNSPDFETVTKKADFDCTEKNDQLSEFVECSLPMAMPGDPELEYSGIAMCECTLIQSYDDLDASRTLLAHDHFSQSVFMSSQSIEKCLKSILSSYKYVFKYFFNLHCATSLFSHLQQCAKTHRKHPFTKYSDQFETLCERFESIGAESWTCPNPLSIRCRYFNFQTNTKFFESRYHYYVDSYPGLVYTTDQAKEAYEIADEIFQLSERIFEELLHDFEYKM